MLSKSIAAMKKIVSMKFAAFMGFPSTDGMYPMLQISPIFSRE
jgi:hypothetical protein